MNKKTSDVDLTGQVAIVTGASRGIGRRIALALGAAGAAVALVGRDETALAETAALMPPGSRTLAIRADVTESAAVNEAVARTETTLGPITLLVNNAGITGVLGPIW